jgi:hypothetical protein
MLIPTSTLEVIYIFILLWEFLKPINIFNMPLTLKQDRSNI